MHSFTLRNYISNSEDTRIIAIIPAVDIDAFSIALQGRWNHVFNCYRAHLERQHGFAEFCFLCSEWVTSKGDWEIHCQGHIDEQGIPFRCDPVTFRRAIARSGHCPVCLGNTDLPLSQRMKYFKDLIS